MFSNQIHGEPGFMYETLRERPQEGEGGNSPIKHERNPRNTEGGKKHQTRVAQSTPKMPK